MTKKEAIKKQAILRKEMGIIEKRIKKQSGKDFKKLEELREQFNEIFRSNY